MNAMVGSSRKLLWAVSLMATALSAGCGGSSTWILPSSHAQDSSLEHVTTATFDDRVLKCDKTVLVDFYAEWCGPCKQLGPLLEEFSHEHPEVRVVKVNVDDNAALTRRYGVSAMPTLLVIRGGQEKDRNVGLVNKEKIRQMVAL